MLVVCLCVCVCERERERGRKKEKERDGCEKDLFLSPPQRLRPICARIIATDDFFLLLALRLVGRPSPVS